MLPLNGRPNMANQVPGNQPQAHSPNFPRPLKRSPSRPITPSQGLVPRSSPSIFHRLPLSLNEVDAELMRIPNTLLPKINQELMIPLDKDLGAMTLEEKVFSSLSSSFVYSPFSLAQDLQPLANKVPDQTSARARYSAATPKSSRSFLDTSHCLVKRLQ